MGHAMSSWETHIAIRDGNITLLEEWLNLGNLNVNVRFRGESLLCTAIKQNQPRIVNLLLSNGADPNLKSKEGGRNEPPLITATRLKNLKIVQILMENGADIHGNNFYGDDVVFQAVVENAFGILEYLLSQIIHGSSKHTDRKGCPLILSIKHAPSHALKKRCLLMLLKYNYLCQCLSISADCESNNAFTEIVEDESLGILFDTDVLKWIYLSKGIRVLYTNDELRNKESIATVCKLKLKLVNLARIKIRQCISRHSYGMKKNFASEVLKLSTPPTLTNFLLMKDVS